MYIVILYGDSRLHKLPEIAQIGTQTRADACTLGRTQCVLDGTWVATPITTLVLL